MTTCFGTIQAAMSTKDFDDDSKLWQFTLDKSDVEYTCRLFNDMRRPTKGDNVLVFLMKDRNHATQVVFDADLQMLSRTEDLK